ncbi:MAG: hypothetical protein ACI8VE_001125, partial [Natrialbaceae archaeon]
SFNRIVVKNRKLTPSKYPEIGLYPEESNG